MTKPSDTADPAGTDTEMAVRASVMAIERLSVIRPPNFFNRYRCCSANATNEANWAKAARNSHLRSAIATACHTSPGCSSGPRCSATVRAIAPTPRAATTYRGLILTPAWCPAGCEVAMRGVTSKAAER